MRVFDHPNMDGGFRCPICRTSADAPVVLVGIPGTEDGNIQQATQIHEACWLLFEKMGRLESLQNSVKAPNGE
jgi:hypothetical protein